MCGVIPRARPYQPPGGLKSALPSLVLAMRILSSLLTFLALIGAPRAVAADHTYTLRWQADATAVELAGLNQREAQALAKVAWDSARWSRLLAVYVEQGDLTADVTTPPMLGEYSVTGRAVRFTPRYPLEPGLKYRAVFHAGGLPGKSGDGKLVLSTVLAAPARAAAPATTLTRVYPGSAVIPENLLKFYLHFSAPMSRGQIYDHIHLRDESGRTVELPFLEIDEELWDPAMTRLTLFIDPGRIKREVKPLEEIGPSLQAGHSYTLVIDRAWQDANGKPLREDFVKRFRVSPPDRDPPDPKQWRITPPGPGTRESLTVVFPEPMDHALAERVIWVTRENGATWHGEASLADDDRHWQLKPAQAWTVGRYYLRVETTIEDLAGNNIGKPFEVDLFDRVDRTIKSPTVQVAFEVK